MMRSVKFAFFILVSYVALVGWSCRENFSTANTKDSVDYNLHIRPILSDRCFKCHGPDGNQRKAHLRLDTYEGAIAALKDNPEGHAIVPGEPDNSEVFLRIASQDTAVVMPPVKSNLKLTSHEIELIKRWISQGAKYKPHWAFIPPKQTALPEIEDQSWPKTKLITLYLPG